MFYTRELKKNISFNLALHYTKGGGYYEQYKEAQDFEDYGINMLNISDNIISSSNLIRRKWLDNDFYGAVYSLNMND